MPRLWNDTIETHRQAVRDATIEATAGLVAERGLRSVTMSQIAEQTGIGRATLYKYFPDVESILREWHDRQLRRHLEVLATARDEGRDALERLTYVLEAYALFHHDVVREHAVDLAALLHGDGHAGHVRHQIRDVLRDLLTEAARNGSVRDDVPPTELAEYCLGALGSASGLLSKAAVRRLIKVTLSGLQPPSDRPS